MAEWLKATDCKSVHVSVRRFEPYSAHRKLANVQMCRYANFEKKFFVFAHLLICKFAYCSSGSSSFGRAIAFQAIGGQFEPGLPLKKEVI